MKTPKEYSQNLKKGIITEEMLADALYSVNKRAKNARDNKNYYRKTRDYYDNYHKYFDEETKYYKLKDKLLSLVNPIKIHKQIIMRENWVFYEEYFVKNPTEGVDYYIEREEDNLYFLYYEVGERSFHTPISDSGLGDNNKYNKLAIEAIESHFQTEGDEIIDLISIQFVNKLISLIESKDYTFILNEKEAAQ